MVNAGTSCEHSYTAAEARGPAGSQQVERPRVEHRGDAADRTSSTDRSPCRCSPPRSAATSGSGRLCATVMDRAVTGGVPTDRVLGSAVYDLASWPTLDAPRHVHLQPLAGGGRGRPATAWCSPCTCARSRRTTSRSSTTTPSTRRCSRWRRPRRCEVVAHRLAERPGRRAAGHRVGDVHGRRPGHRDRSGGHHLRPPVAARPQREAGDPGCERRRWRRPCTGRT